MCLFPVEMNTKLLSYSQSLGPVSVSSRDRYDMMLSSTFTLLILIQHSLPQLPQTSSVHFSHQKWSIKTALMTPEMRNYHHHHSAGWEHRKE